MSFAAAPSTPENAIAGMLAMLRAMAALFVETFGAPAALIKGGAIYGKTRARILRWLHDMECVVRRLLLLRAALFPAPAPRPVRTHSKSAARRRKEGDPVTLFGPNDDPAQWRVAFRLPTPPEPTWIYARDLGGFRAHEDAYELGHSAFAAAKAASADKRVESAQNGGASLAAIGVWADDPRRWPNASKPCSASSTIPTITRRAWRSGCMAGVAAWSGSSFSWTGSAPKRRSPMKPGCRMKIGRPSPTPAPLRRR